jgi:response regulator RpfG family c-di-GMP phosphodiesterase
MTPAEARAEIARQAGSQFDPELTIIFLMITADSESDRNLEDFARGASLA